jgi:hypothetical protein
MSVERRALSAEGLKSQGWRSALRAPRSLTDRSGRRLNAVVLSGMLLATSGCEWFTDFKRQPHVVTWESWRPDSLGVRGSPQGSVPTDGTAMPAWMVSYTPSIAAIDSLAGIQNPVAVTEA